MQNIYIPSHLILTKKQKEQLRSIPVTEFTDKEWKSQKDASLFLKQHNLLENKKERVWKTRYSDIAKNIRLFQCGHGINQNLRPKTDQKNKVRKRKTRQIHKFTGCLAHVRVKTFKNKNIHIFGYLNHSEECQRNSSYILDNNEIDKQTELWREVNEAKTNTEEFEKQIELWRKANEGLYPWDEFNEIINSHVINNR
jgi:hypothetical protein